MANDLFAEGLIGAAEATAVVPSRPSGKKLHVKTVHRWLHHGCRGVRLEGLRIGEAWYTTRPALQRFFERLTADAHGEPATIRTPKARERAIAAAEAQLAAATA